MDSPRYSSVQVGHRPAARPRSGRLCEFDRHRLAGAVLASTFASGIGRYAGIGVASRRDSHGVAGGIAGGVAGAKCPDTACAARVVAHAVGGSGRQ